MTGGPVELIVEDDLWLDHLPDLEEVANRGAAMALRETGADPAGVTIAVLACDDARIAALNADFRGRPQPTNVLSWPAFDLAPDLPGGRPAAPPGAPRSGPSGPSVGGTLSLGDVAIARQTCLAEAQIGAIPLKNHVTHLILHSVLHLLGYDHQDDEDARIMEGLESRAMLAEGLPDPYGSPRDGPA